MTRIQKFFVVVLSIGMFLDPISSAVDLFWQLYDLFNLCLL